MPDKIKQTIRCFVLGFQKSNTKRPKAFLHCITLPLAMLIGAMCQFCTGSLNAAKALPGWPAIQQLFVYASMEQLFLYILNLLVRATFLPQKQLRVVPILTGVFVEGRWVVLKPLLIVWHCKADHVLSFSSSLYSCRLVYWLCLHICSPWRGFGSGITIFPLLAMVTFDLYCLYDISLRHLLFGSGDTLCNQTTPSSWPLEMSQSPSGKFR